MSTDSASAADSADPTAAVAAPPLASRAWRSSVATLGAHLGGNVVRLASNLALTRLLAPEDFGVMALVGVFVQGLHMFSDLGIGPSIVQHKDGDEPTFVRTAFTIQALRGAWLMTGSVVLAWPMALFYDLPAFHWMVPLAGVSALIDGFTSTKLFRANRRLQLGRVGVIEVATQLITALSMVALALVTGSVLALLLGSIIGALARVALTHMLLPGFRDGFAWDPEARKALLSFGRWVFLSTAITFIAMQLDRLMLGRLVAPEILGVYSIAVMLAAVPREVLGTLMQRVLYPLVAELLRADASGQPVRVIRLRVLYLLVVPLGVLAGTSEALFDVLYDDRYRAGGQLMALLCIGTWLNVLGSTYGVVVLSMGWPKWISYGTALKTLTIGSFVVPVHAAWGLPGVTLLISASEAAVATFTCLGCRNVGVITVGRDIALTIATIATGIAVHFGQAHLTRWAGTPVLGLALFALFAAAVTGVGARRLGLLGGS